MKCLAWFIVLVATVLNVRAEGTIQFFNSPLSRVQLRDPMTGVSVPMPLASPIVFGAFVNGSDWPVLPLVNASRTALGIIDGALDYPIPNTLPGAVINLQIRGWSAEYGTNWQSARMTGATYGETDVRSVRLEGPPVGAVIWQSLTGTNPNRFYPLILDLPAGLNVEDVTVAEGSNGVVNAVFTVRLLKAQEQTVTVNYATQDGSAVAGQDYTAVEGALTFNPGEVMQTVTVSVTADPPAEADEWFSLVLSNPANAIIRRSVGIAWITEARILELRVDAVVVFHSVAGQRYALERTTDLTTWNIVPGAENIVGIGGPMTISDPGAGCNELRIYRTRLVTQ